MRRCLEYPGRPRETGGGRGREAGVEIKKAIVCCLLLGIIQSIHAHMTKLALNSVKACA